jgi:hypothetical protein
MSTQRHCTVANDLNHDAMLCYTPCVCEGVPSRASLAAQPLPQRAAAWGNALGGQPKHSSIGSTANSSTIGSSTSSDETTADQQSSTSNSGSSSNSSSDNDVTVAAAGGLLTAGAPSCRRTEACVTEVSNLFQHSADTSYGLLLLMLHV